MKSVRPGAGAAIQARHSETASVRFDMVRVGVGAGLGGGIVVVLVEIIEGCRYIKLGVDRVFAANKEHIDKPVVVIGGEVGPLPSETASRPSC